MDMPGEIFDMPETLDELIPEDEEKFDVEAHIKSNITFWHGIIHQRSKLQQR